MKLESILTPARTYSRIVAGSKKRAIEEAAIQISRGIEDLTAEEIYERLINREKVGTTAIGHGVAIPHCRIDNYHDIIGALFRLDTPVDFGAFDDELVSIMFVLLVPSEQVEEHLQTLAMLAARFESDDYRRSLLTAVDDAELYKRAIADIPLHNRA